MSILLIFSQPWVANLLLYPLEFWKFEINEIKTKPEVIFVPACYYHSGGKVPEITRWHECSLQRMLLAYQLHLELQVPIHFTGGNFLNDESIFFADKAKSFMTSLGVDGIDIVAIPKGYNTRSEVIALNATLAGKTIVAVSSATHRYRLSSLLSDFKIQHQVLSVDFHSSGELTPYITIPSYAALNNTGKAIYEYMAIAKYFVYDSRIAV
ncbi:YdcF family protein [Alteromonas genovensis]|uniref:YdcF family protein n=1 Tax=Alteromonas genovensis TaxID=471225 RepID=A0A6N9TAJ4_9ALTE|nr:ElyC/SanA/YdcF family protein [Alteromonas genovensis]NDW14313.1 YdcF family protein [Alteromonas genovensis]